MQFGVEKYTIDTLLHATFGPDVLPSHVLPFPPSHFPFPPFSFSPSFVLFPFSRPFSSPFHCLEDVYNVFAAHTKVN